MEISVVDVIVEVAVSGNPGPQGIQGEVAVDPVAITGAPGSQVVVTDLDPSPHKALIQFQVPEGEKGGVGPAGPTKMYVQDEPPDVGIQPMGYPLWLDTDEPDPPEEGYIANIISGLWMPLWTLPGFNTQALAAGILRATRVVVPNAMNAIQVEVTTLGATSIQVAVYEDTPTGPGALLAQTASISCAAIGNFVSDISIPPGACWIAVQNIGAASVTLRGAGGTNPSLSGHDPAVGASVFSAWQVIGQGTALPNQFPPTGIARNVGAVHVFLRAA